MARIIFDAVKIELIEKCYSLAKEKQKSMHIYIIEKVKIKFTEGKATDNIKISWKQKINLMNDNRKWLYKIQTGFVDNHLKGVSNGKIHNYFYIQLIWYSDCIKKAESLFLGQTSHGKIALVYDGFQNLFLWGNVEKLFYPSLLQ